MQKEIVIQRLRERGCRITRQRQILLDIILQGDCVSCKEIYYQASSKEPAIGAATVYRMLNLLEDIGAISRKNTYKISDCTDCNKEGCTIVYDDNTYLRLSADEWQKVISEGLKVCGYENEKDGRIVIAVF